MARKSSRTERALILACALASAGMNLSAADVTSPRSVAAYAVPPIALAIAVDRVVAVIRRHVLAGEEVSAWTTLASFLAGVAQTAAIVLLYSLRFILAPPSTAAGVRRWILNLAPLPEAGPPRPETTRSAIPAPALTSAARQADPAAPAVGDAALNGLAGLGIPGANGADPTPPPSAPDDAADQPVIDDAADQPVTDDAIVAFYAAELNAGRVPSGKAIRRQFNVGSDRADRIVARLTAARAAEGRSG